MAVGIAPGSIRVSVGLENVNDIMADIDQALIASQKARGTVVGD
ncbi:MAG: PLP-dependent transferase [Cytophagales bacterium]|nr:PLP-dependent transferase [Cytophagales bacterium]MCA6369679.1 PLP-dependent transferase [Cytophagales bacterium]MCA6372444.1 PLP-dependent transferase [Cytophagales bacterium]MCA6378021.1 PLP-dependent transferase [Cytophagales bacterium]MCA6386080.1 PLP-dependent transferase [Cytophagales bacterium]